MIDIFKRRSTIHLDCFTMIPEVVELFPIETSSKCLPQWWKELKSTVEYQGPERGTLKRCPGIGDLFTSGFVIPAWRDFWFSTNSGMLTIRPENTADIHHPSQWGSALKNYNHAKLISPWKIKEKTGTKFLFSNVFWYHNDHRFFVPNGVVEYKINHTTNVNIVIQKNIFPKEFYINAGQPLVQCIPLTDKKIKLHLHLINELEYTRMQSYHFTFSGQYYKVKKILQDRKK